MSSTNGDRVPQDRGNYGSSSSEWASDRRENHRWREESDKNVDGVDVHGGELDHSGSGGAFSMRPIFLGNISYEATPADVQDIFTNPFVPYSPEGSGIDPNAPIYVDHVDMKRGFCFVFLKDVSTEAEKVRIEHYVSEINGLNIPKLSNALRSEFARGDGRVKRKEDLRREHIAPSETLFVVNFHEDTTKREDLQMLFEPFGKLLRIDMKRNYAFVQFETVEQATAAKEATDGGKLDQSKITVEYVARKMDNRPRGDSYRGGPPPSRDDYGSSRGGGGRYADSRGGGDRYPMDRGGDRYGGGGGRGRGGDRTYTSENRDRDRSPPHYSRGGGGGGGRDHSPPSTRDRYYDDRSRGRSPDRGRYGGDRYGSPDRGHLRGRGGGSSDRYDSYEGSRRDAGRGRDKSRSRSPAEYRSSASRRSPPRGRDYDYEYGRRESRGRSPDYAHRRDVYREDRGYSRD